MKCFRKHYPCLVVLAAYIVCIILANPVGEFPLNDDWSYARSAFGLSSGHGLNVDDWAAPSLVGQALYGGLLARLFSPHFLVLRLSTLILSCCTVMLLWGIFRRIAFRKDLACIMLFAWVFNPIQFNLSFTYMTEVPFLFFIVLALSLYVRYRIASSPGILIASAAALGYAFLIRQTALFFLLALLCAVLIDVRERLVIRLRHSVWAAATFSVFAASYFLWIADRGGSTAAVHNKFELLHLLSQRQIAGNTYGMIFYLVFMALPVWLLLIPCTYRLARSLNKKTRILVLTALPLFIATGLWWYAACCRQSPYLPSIPYHSRMPFLINVLNDTGLGPLTLDPDYDGPSPTPTYPHAWMAVTIVVAAGALLCGLLCTAGMIRRRRLAFFQEHRPLYAFAGLALICVTFFEIIFSHLREGGLFDRHVLIAAFPFYLLLGLFSSKEEGKSKERMSGIVALFPAGIAIAALSLFCVAATHDYMEWNRIRWNMGRSLIERGIDPLSIAGGFEFNAWHNYDTYLARGIVKRAHGWWYDKREYTITMLPQAGYDVVQKQEYFSWLHRRSIPLYLAKCGPVRDKTPLGARHISHE